MEMSDYWSMPSATFLELYSTLDDLLIERHLMQVFEGDAEIPIGPVVEDMLSDVAAARAEAERIGNDEDVHVLLVLGYLVGRCLLGSERSKPSTLPTRELLGRYLETSGRALARLPRTIEALGVLVNVVSPASGIRDPHAIAITGLALALGEHEIVARHEGLTSLGLTQDVVTRVGDARP
jgi:hypothetical protein